MSYLRVLCLLLLASLTPALAGAQTACTHYAAPDGGGTGLSPGSPFHIADFWPVARPGRTLCLLDGTYTGSQNLIHVPPTFAGTPSQRITIRALNDGKVLLDGQGATRPVDLQGSYGILEGVNARNGNDYAFVDRGSHWISRRIVAWSTGTVFADTISIVGDHGTIEDCAVFGNGRYTLAAGAGGAGQKFNIIRRCWSSVYSAQGETTSLMFGYGQGAVTMENVLANWNIDNDVANNPQFFAFRTQNSRILGLISYSTATDKRIPGPFMVNGQGGSKPAPADKTLNFLGKQILAFIHPNNPRFATASGIRTQADALADNNRLEDVISIAIKNGVDSNFPISNFRTGTTIANALAGSGHSNVWTALPGICKRYTSQPGDSSSVLTEEGLWPGGRWPMNQRIIDAHDLANRPIVDITRTMEDLLGPIPAQCRGTGSGERSIR